ncbi:hypothetical protein GCM10027037_01300 [Mucilaginibacter koreensis]
MDKATIQNRILQMATERGTDKTICPSEVARALFPVNWRNHMDEIRDAAFELRDTKQVMITQKGEVQTNNNLKGPIRIRIINR